VAKRKTKDTGKQKKLKAPEHGIVHIHASFNNTVVTVTDKSGNTIVWASAGSIGYKGTRKGTPFAATRAAETAVQKALSAGMRTAEVWVNGPGRGRESAIRTVQAAGMNVSAIRDVTPLPHNGCRPPKKRRL
jgi:small subunit ribosomal protein S11